ncbi:MAG: rRNA maturation RNase YbeY [Chthoniobacterales bacterium]
MPVSFSIQNRQRKIRFDGSRVKKLAIAALPFCTAAAKQHKLRRKLPETLEASIVSDAVIARVHRDFMNIDGPTDVITFPYGEIVLSAETAQCYAKIHGASLEEELALYLIHGVLHLLGFDDIQPKDAAVMKREQEKILKAVCREVC